MKLSALVIIFTSLSFVGCHSTIQNHSACLLENGQRVNCGEIATQTSSKQLQGWDIPTKRQFNPRYHHKLLNDYVEQMAMTLVDTMQARMGNVAVASFVDLDSTLNNTNVLGNQISENFIYEMQQFGFAIVDYKSTGSLEVTPQGDFAFSRDYKNLSQHQMIDYVLSGTMIYAEKGVVINARVVSTDDKVVAASARGFIPYFVVDSVFPVINRGL